jgi:hypothetical protein
MPNWQVSVSSCSRYLTTGLLRRDCQSPVGVIRVVLTVRRSLPVHPYHRTFAGYLSMSQTCHKRKSRNKAWAKWYVGSA